MSISFAGYSASCTSNNIDVSSGPAVSSLFSTSLTVPTGTAGTMDVVWNYNGEYSGVSLPTVTASDYVFTD